METATRQPIAVVLSTGLFSIAIGLFLLFEDMTIFSALFFIASFFLGTVIVNGNNALIGLCLMGASLLTPAILLHQLGRGDSELLHTANGDQSENDVAHRLKLLSCRCRRTASPGYAYIVSGDLENVGTETVHRPMVHVMFDVSGALTYASPDTQKWLAPGERGKFEAGEIFFNQPAICTVTFPRNLVEPSGCSSEDK